MDQPALRDFDAALRTRFDAFLMMVHHTVNPGVPFLENWHIDAMVNKAEGIIQGDEKRLIVNVPPRSFKTVIFNIALSAFALGHNPRAKIFCISYGERLAEDQANQFRAVVESAWYQRVFPRMRIKRVADNDFFTTERGFRRWASIGGALTGMGGEMFVVDDPIKPEDVHSQTRREAVNNWFGGTMLSRLNNKRESQIVVVMQRLHLDDLTGYLLRETQGWSLLSLPAIAIVPEDVPLGRGCTYSRQAGELLHPEREDESAYAELRETMGPARFSAQYQQRPVPTDGEFLDSEWFRFYDEPPTVDRKSYVIQSWDTATKDGLTSAYSACVTLLVHQGNYFLLDVTRQKLNFPALRQLALALSDRFKPRYILIEDASTGPALAAEIRWKQKAIVKLEKPKVDKRVRLFIEQPKFASGRVWFPRSAPWLRAFLDELLSFPEGRYSDQVDALSQALAFKLTYHLDNVMD